MPSGRGLDVEDDLWHGHLGLGFYQFNAKGLFVFVSGAVPEADQHLIWHKFLREDIFLVFFCSAAEADDIVPKGHLVDLVVRCATQTDDLKLECRGEGLLFVLVGGTPEANNVVSEIQLELVDEGALFVVLGGRATQADDLKLECRAKDIGFNVFGGTTKANNIVPEV